MQQIVKQKVETEITRLQKKGYILEYDENILPFLMNTGVSPEFGARPVVQTVQKYIALAIISSNKNAGTLTIGGTQLMLY